MAKCAMEIPMGGVILKGTLEYGKLRGQFTANGYGCEMVGNATGGSFVGPAANQFISGQMTMNCTGDFNLRYKGEFLNLAPHGKGAGTYGNGDTYVGNWREGEMYGEGTYTAYGGQVQKGIWRNGKLQKTSKASDLKNLFTKLSSYDRKTIQTNLKKLGLYQSSIDGLYGKGTASALKTFNKINLKDASLTNKTNISKLFDAVLENSKNKTCSSSTPEACSAAKICEYATAFQGPYRLWQKTPSTRQYNIEANERGLHCGIQNASTTVWIRAGLNNSTSLPDCSSNFNNCVGSMIVPDYGKYFGEFKDGLPHGQGIFNYQDGAVYIGQWQKDMFHGKGTLTGPDGDKYAGNWQGGKMQGQGTYTFANGTTRAGFWENGTLKPEPVAKTQPTAQVPQKTGPSFFELLGAFAQGYNAATQGYSGSQSSSGGLRLKDSYRSGGNTMCRYNDGSVYNIGLGICPITNPTGSQSPNRGLRLKDSYRSGGNTMCRYSDGSVYNIGLGICPLTK